MMKKLLCTLILTFIAIGFVQAQGEIDVTGNGISIAGNGSNTPSTTDGTDFGSFAVNQASSEQLFEIVNSSASTLTIISTVVSNDDFVITTTPSATVAGNSSTTIGLTYQGSATAQVATAQLFIINTDPDESNYFFNISATTVDSPDINVQGNSIDIPSNGTPNTADGTDFGSFETGTSSSERFFLVQNTGGQTLNITSSFIPNGAFVITTPLPSTIAANSSASIGITFNAPATAQTVNTSLFIIHNDSDENPYQVNLTAESQFPPEPDVNVQGNGINIADGSSTPNIADGTDFEDVNVGSSLSRTFTIQNTGSAPLEILGLQMQTGSNSQFSVDISGITNPVPAGGSTTFNVVFNATTAGQANGTVLIETDDPDASEEFYTFAVTANGVIVTEPDIEVADDSNTIVIVDADSTPSTADGTDFGTTTIGNAVTSTFTIRNTGNADLDITNLGFSIGSNAQFTINSSGLTSPLPAGQTTTFNVVFTPTTVGVANATVRIRSNDPDAEDPYTFAVTATVQAANAPEMDVLDNASNALASGGSVDYGTLDVSTGSLTYTFTIQNTGTDVLNLTDASPYVVISGANASDFTLGTVPNPSIAASGSTTFTITFDPSATGTRTATVSIANNDSNENPYTFTLTGEGTDTNVGSPLLITQYYENGDNDYIEIKNISASTVPQQFYLCLYRNLRTTTNIITTQAPGESIQIPSLAPGQVVVFKNPAASGAGTSTAASVFDGNDVLLISSTNDNGCYNARIDIVGVVGSSTPPVWGANTSFIKGCGTNESPSLSFAYDAGTNTVTDYIELTTAEVDAAASGTNIALGTQTVGSTTYTSSWSNGIPDKTKNTIINGSYNGSTGSFDACNLTINASGNLSFTGTTNYVKVEEDLFINGTFTLGDQAALITVDENATISGSITKQESTTTLKQYDFTYWSSPVQNATTAVFTGTGAPAERIFEWRAPSSGDWGGWQNYSGTLTPAKGYISEGPDGATVHNVSFSGTPNNGIISINVGFDNTTPNGGGGFNLVGNPYPCAIDIDEFILLDDNDAIRDNTDIDGTIWLWTHNTEYQDNEGIDGDYVVEDYVTYNLTGSTGGVTNNIGSGQGFFVQAKNAGAIFFTHLMKLDGQNTQFFRGNDKKKSSKVSDRIWLTARSNSGGAYNRILVGFSENATDAEDRGYDGVKFSAGNYISLYSTIENKRYAIQGLGAYNSDKRVNIGFDAYVQEKFTIEADKIEGILNSEEIYLVDNYLNIVHDLKASPYEFEINETGSFADRFTLQFNKSTLSVDDELLNNSFVVMNEENSLRIKASTSVSNIKVYDMLGRLLINSDPKELEFTLNTENIANGSVLILNATLENGAEVSKKAIKY